MKSILLCALLLFASLFTMKADRIYLMNSTGYNSAEPGLISAMQNLGHTVTVNAAGASAFPQNFTSRCIDSTNGYDWLCFFGNGSFASLLPQIQAFINVGGKVFYQYEVGCCTVASADVATVLTGLTGLSITPNSNPFLAVAIPPPGWTAANLSCCTTFFGAAYKALDGLPPANQLLVTAGVGSSFPSFTLSPNFGFVFTTNDFVGTAHKGAIVGIGDYNIWYDGQEPLSNGGTMPLNPAIVNYFFPNDTSTCFLLPPGCLEVYSGGGTTAISLNLGNDTTLCDGQNLLLSAGNPGASYLWQNNSTGATFNVTQAGTYWVKVTNNCGTATDTIHINYLPTPTVNLGNDTTICLGQTITLQTNSIGSTFQWQDNSSNASFTVSQSGTYWVKVSNACGNVTDTIQITVANPPIFSLGNDTSFCAGNTLLLNASTAGATYLWQNGNTSPTFLVNQSGTYWVKVTQACSSIDTIQVQLNPLPIVNLGPDKSICFGDTLLLNAATSNATYRWQDNSTNSFLKASQTGMYWVEITSNLCKASDTIYVTRNPYFDVNIGADTSLCEGDTVLLQTNNTNATYEWQDNSTLSYYQATQTGSYAVEVTINNCQKSDTAFIDFKKKPQVNLGPDLSLCKNESITLNAYTSGATYTWQDGSHASTLFVNQSGIYTVEVEVDKCKGDDEVKIDFDRPNCVCNVFVPNAFSPNNDLVNDELRLLSTKGIELKEFKIFNRWGNEVFSTSTLEYGWDGKYKTNKAETGTYFYYLRYICQETGKEIVSKGDITLVY